MTFCNKKLSEFVKKKTPICTKIAQIYHLKIATKLFTTNIPTRFIKKTKMEFALFTWFTFWQFWGNYGYIWLKTAIDISRDFGGIYGHI